MKKLVLIGGGENGRIRNNGEKLPYETYEIDKEIVHLTNKKHPNFLFMGYSQIGKIFGKSPEENIRKYYEVMCKIYYDIFKCKCDYLTMADLNDYDKLKNKILNADIIYEGGGSTKDCIRIIKDNKLDVLIKKAMEKGTVISGISAGMNMQGKISLSGEKYQINKIDKPDVHIGLGLVNAVLVPHFDKDNYRRKHLKTFLSSHKQYIGLALDECCALEIIDDTYKIITSKENVGIHKCYYKNEKYIIENIKPFSDFRKIKELLNNSNE